MVGKDDRVEKLYGSIRSNDYVINDAKYIVNNRYSSYSGDLNSFVRLIL